MPIAKPIDPKLATADIALAKAFVPAAKPSTSSLRLVGVTCNFHQLDDTGAVISQAGRPVEVSIVATAYYVQGIRQGDDGAEVCTYPLRTLKDLGIADAIVAALQDAGLVE